MKDLPLDLCLIKFYTIKLTLIYFRPNLIEDTVSDELIASHAKDLDYIHQLKETTLTCMDCRKRHVIDQKVSLCLIGLAVSELS